MDEDDEGGMELVMPFVVCQSQGGPFDDHAFVNGCQLGQILGELEALELHPLQPGWSVSWYVNPDLVPQLDLVAMHHGLVVSAVPWEEHPDDWVYVTFTKPVPDEIEAAS